MFQDDVSSFNNSSKSLKLAVYLFSDEKTIFSLGNVVLQLQNYKFVDTILLFIDSENLDLRNQLSMLDKRIRFIEYSIHDIIKYLKFDIASNEFIKKYGLSVFTRFLIIPYLNEFDSIVILDSDLLIQKPFLDCIDPSYPLIFKPAGAINRYIRDVPDQYLYPAGGFIVINKSLIEYDIKPNDFFELLNKYNSVPHIDEVVFGLIIYNKKLNPKVVDELYNCNPSSDNSSNAYIIHGLSIFKFWTNPVTNYLYPAWNHYNFLWNDFCDKNNLSDFKFHTNFQYNLTNSKLFLIPHLLAIQIRLIDIHSDLHVFTSIKNNFVEIFINNIDKKFCFRIYTKVHDFYCTIRLVDLRESRCSSQLYKNNFIKFRQCECLSNFQFNLTDKCFTAESSVIHFEKLLVTINTIYLNIKSHIVSYFCSY